jgi:hypothetical protein
MFYHEEGREVVKNAHQQDVPCQMDNQVGQYLPARTSSGQMYMYSHRDKNVPLVTYGDLMRVYCVNKSASRIVENLGM